MCALGSFHSTKCLADSYVSLSVPVAHSFYCWVLFNFMTIWQFPYPFTCWWTFGLFPVLGYYELTYHEHSFMACLMCACPISHSTYKYRFWIIGQVQISLYKKLACCFPKRLYHFISSPHPRQYLAFCVSAVVKLKCYLTDSTELWPSKSREPGSWKWSVSLNHSHSTWMWVQICAHTHLPLTLGHHGLDISETKEALWKAEIVPYSVELR